VLSGFEQLMAAVRGGEHDTLVKLATKDLVAMKDS
jgi:hypothetical protein